MGLPGQRKQMDDDLSDPENFLSERTARSKGQQGRRP